MSIQLLSPRLANQIAAGEVVERPASVVKELVENSLDAGATQIIIDIEKGGAKLMRIRDNGCGVPKEQLILALSRHATSKIIELDDLEAIVSLGFRGEALASISSVSRLHFTSKTAEQHEAWQAYAQGRDMEVEITPAAHPIGTSVSVEDLFFNTPARRRFLRTEKTEFNHIDELIKRFALSRFDVEFQLKHNDKSLRNLKVATTLAQQERRVAAICGSRFIENAIAISNEHNGIKLSGWLGLPQACKNVNDTQYCYVNGRMMRDKLINHAIRQAYQDYLPTGIHPSYVLYIEIDPGQVDVNVHPAKHEVRFHQARMIHDLIAQVLGSGLMQALGQEDSIDSAQHHYSNHQELVSEFAVTENVKDYSASASRAYQPSYSASSGSASHHKPHTSEYQGANLRQAATNYGQLVATGVSQTQTTPSHAPHIVGVDEEASSGDMTTNTLFGEFITVIEEQYALVNCNHTPSLVSLVLLNQLICEQELIQRWGQGLTSQPLLLPVAVTVDEALLEQVALNNQLFRRLGIDISVRSPQIMIKQVPKLLREQDIATLIPQLLTLLGQQQQLEQADLDAVVCRWLAKLSPLQFNVSEAVALLTKAQQHQEHIQQRWSALLVNVDFSTTISAFKQTNE
ncbi:DNA mismatch repair endonuclease MutL [Psychrobium sp. 1_MG-2023]|uniref:DNA mismatch repair endonuclease MutL n=1 Tax=Psychrobium sp. 1_MG-2023 TaxID=3062624 RepID=UPI000C335938|nr:DNA mismatch repair endonuclease MutL [Psychrobium sp. 1_MG-2023]MDP2559723.1 DNA mismatch repair endonuclease MutL [Psychrobium sp. 1_MG-2023]PKF59552.1 DNA mismatch repair endonuclease MutL [Alteromonadales bacterium alter-6D02]